MKGGNDRMGATVYMNGTWYYFENVENLESVLDENCNDAGFENGKTYQIELEREE